MRILCLVIEKLCDGYCKVVEGLKLDFSGLKNEGSEVCDCEFFVFLRSKYCWWGYY